MKNIENSRIEYTRLKNTLKLESQFMSTSVFLNQFIKLVPRTWNLKYLGCIVMLLFLVKVNFLFVSSDSLLQNVACSAFAFKNLLILLLLFWLGMIFFCSWIYTGKQRGSTARNKNSNILFSITKLILSDGTVNFEAKTF